MRTVYIGADSAGFEMKKAVKEHLNASGYSVVDLGADTNASSHYPIFAEAVARHVAANANSVGILICGTGIGMSMAANKVKGIRAALCGDTFSARMTRQHNDANVLCLGARVIGQGLALDIVDLFLATPFEAGGRHSLRVDMIGKVETGEPLTPHEAASPVKPC